MQKTVRFSDIR